MEEEEVVLGWLGGEGGKFLEAGMEEDQEGSKWSGVGHSRTFSLRLWDGGGRMGTHGEGERSEMRWTEVGRLGK